MPRWPLVIALCTCLASGATGAGAQQKEYILQPGGEWKLERAPEPGTDEAFIAEARVLIAEGQFIEARRALSKWLERNKLTDNPFLAEAYILRGDARQGMGDEYLALYDYKKVTLDFEGTRSFITAIERQMAIAIKYVNGMKRRFLGIRWYGAESEGEELLVRVGELMPLSVLAERAALELIAFYYRKGDLEWCATTCEIFLVNFPRSRYRARVLEYRINSNRGLFAGPEYDGSYLVEARELVKQYMAEFPAEAERRGLDEAALAWIDDSAADQILHNAKWYLRHGEHASAKYTLKKLVREYSLTVAASQAYQIMVEKGWASGATAPGPIDLGPSGGDGAEPAEPAEGAGQ
jgi:hypothetical protein